MAIQSRYQLLLAQQAFQAGDTGRAEHFANEALSVDSKSADALLLMGVIKGLQNSHHEAEEFLRRAANIERRNPFVFFNLAKALSEQDKDREALKWHKKALELDPRHAESWLNYGKSLFKLKEFRNAISVYDRALAINRDLAQALTNKGACLRELGSPAEAVGLHDHALSIQPNLAEAWFNRAVAFRDLGRHDDVVIGYRKAIELAPDMPYLLGNLIHAQMKICDWNLLQSQLEKLKAKLFNRQKVTFPFAVLGLFDSPELQKLSAEIFVAEKIRGALQLGPIARRSRHDKIRVGYFSMDFREHPIAFLIADLIKYHDRNQFQVFGFSYGDNTRDAIRQRLEEDFDKFFDLKGSTDLEIARLSREMEIDIAIDLGGHTRDSRPQIFIERAAPIQINYLGYPGTWGDSCMDYFIGDKVAITNHNQSFFTEKIIYLPNQFQVNPETRSMTNDLSRHRYGLPENSFVYCCFNNNWKFTPELFEVWMRILQRVPNSILWLYADTPIAAGNLRAEARKYGVPDDRLLFAKRVSREEYLTQYQVADLFLDTLPYNAGTTTSDALWAGLPVLTLAGQSFAGRMAASLLANIGLSELICHSAEAYESLAVELASNQDKLQAIKRKLCENRTNSPLFNTRLFARHLESAYQTIYERYQAGLSPDVVYVNS